MTGTTDEHRSTLMKAKAKIETGGQKPEGGRRLATGAQRHVEKEEGEEEKGKNDRKRKTRNQRPKRARGR